MRGREERPETATRIEIRSGLLARNTLLNLIAQAVPLLIGVVSIPFIIRGLGIERFGLLSLVWVVLGYFTVFDLGIGRATTKYVAEELGKGDGEQLPQLVWTAVTVQVLLGLVGTLVLAIVTPLVLAKHILNIPPELVQEARDTLYILALAIPVVLVSGSFSGVLEAAQRFDLENAVKMPSSALTYLLPLVGVVLGMRLPGIVALILLVRCMAMSAFVLLSLRTFPSLKGVLVKPSLFPRLFCYGGWITISAIAAPFLAYLDRFLIASLLSMGALAYYSAPYEAVVRLGIVPASLSMTLFPAFSALDGSKDRRRTDILFARAVKFVLVTLGPIVLVAALYAEQALQVWLGASFAIESAAVFRILAIGVLVNAIAYIPFTLLQGTGRPDLPAKFHLLELPIYVGVAWLLVNRWGIAGAAWAWTLRMVLDALLLFAAASRVHGLSPRSLRSSGAGHAFCALLTLGGACYALSRLAGGLPLVALGLLLAGLLVLFAWYAWQRILDDADRGAIRSALKPRRKLEAPTV